MNGISSTLFWLAMQTTILALLTLVLGSRPWRIGGAWAPLFGLLGVSLITAFAFLPVPGRWDLESLDWKIVRSSIPVTSIDPLAHSEPTESWKYDAMAEGWTLGEVDLAPNTLESGASNSIQIGAEPSAASRLSGMGPTIVGCLFGLGMVVGTLRLLVGLIATRRLLQSCRPIHDKQLEEAVTVLRAELGLKTPIGIFETDKLSTAATLGSRRPVVLLPTHWRGWTEAELNAVLAHELAHIAHGDFAAVLISQVSVVMHFYHPLVHWLSHRMRLEQELAADAVAARFAGGQSKYLKVLAKLALEHEDRFVGWPARAFLPTRQTFLRRLEMLRDVKLSRSERAYIGRWVAMVAIGLASIALIGMKPPMQQAIAQGAVAKLDSKGTGDPYDLRYFSDEGGIVIAMKPSALLASKALSEVAGQFQALPQVSAMLAPLGVELKDMEQCLVSLRMPDGMPVSVYIRSSKPIGKLNNALLGKPGMLAGADILAWPSGDLCLWKPDERSLVIGSKRNVERGIQGRQIQRQITDTDLWKSLKERPLIAISEGGAIRNAFRGIRSPNGTVSLLMTTLSPILDEAEALGIAASLESDWSLVAMAKSTDVKGAETIKETTQAGVVLLKNALREWERTLRSQPETPVLATEAKNAMTATLSVGIKLAEAVKVHSEGGMVNLTTNIKSSEIPVGSIANVFLQTRKASARTTSVNNLKQIALAFHNFHDSYRQFPHSVKSPNPNHKHPVSWRVLILPFIEQNALYEAYRFDEPWDGPNNIQLLSKMPRLYRYPDAAPDSTESNYAMLVGPETICPPNKTLRITDILDGTSNTLMVVEAKKSIPWTKPEDLDYSKDKPLPAMGGFSEGGFNAAFADGSVRFLGTTMEESMLRSMISASGGEVIGK